MSMEARLGGLVINSGWVECPPVPKRQSLYSAEYDDRFVSPGCTVLGKGSCQKMLKKITTLISTCLWNAMKQCIFVFTNMFVCNKSVVKATPPPPPFVVKDNQFTFFVTLSFSHT